MELSMLQRIVSGHLLRCAAMALVVLAAGCSSELPQQASGKETSADAQQGPGKTSEVDPARKKMLEEALSKSHRPASSGTNGSQGGGAAPAPVPGPVSAGPVWRDLGIFPWTEDQRATYEGFDKCLGTPDSIDKSSCSVPKKACRFDLQSPCTEQDNPGLANCVRLFYCE